MGDSSEDLDQDLFAHLERVEGRILDICDGGHIFDPNLVMTELEAETSLLHQCVEKLVADLDNQPRRSTDLNHLVDMASREFLMTATFPLVIRTTADRSLPELRYADEAVLAAVIRCLEICADHAGPGCEIALTTVNQGSCACLKVEAKATKSLREPTLPVKVRSISLSDLVRSLGGDLQINQAQDLLTVELQLGVNAPTI